MGNEAGERPMGPKKWMKKVQGETRMAEFFKKFKELDIFGVKHNTNKSSRWRKPDGAMEDKMTLLDRYEFFLREKKTTVPFTLLELGAGPDHNIGASMRCWKEYFKDTSNLHVADINANVAKLQAEGFKTHVGDLGDVGFLQQLAAMPWDFVLDDASHLWHHQIIGFRRLFPAVKPGGIYILEDLCTSFGHFRPVYNMSLDQKDTVFYLLAMTRVVASTNLTDNENIRSVYNLTDTDIALGRTIDMMAWIGNACIIVKK